MAELLLVTNPGGYEDGDVIHAMNDLRIHLVHASHICGSWNLDKANHVWYDPALAEEFLATVRRYKTERISRTEARVTDQWESTSIIKSDIANQHGHVMHVQQFFSDRLKSVPHLVFGTPGAEIYYSGGQRYLATEDTYIWQQIEQRTAYLKADFSEFNWNTKNGGSHLQNYLAITVDDFDNAERAELESPLYDDKVDPPVILKNRKHGVDWKNLTGITQQIIDDVLIVDVHTHDELVNGELIPVWGGGIKVDIRDSLSFSRAQIVDTKTAVVI